MPKIKFPNDCNPFTLRLVGGKRKCDHDFTSEAKDDGKILSWKCTLCGTEARVAKLER